MSSGPMERLQSLDNVEKEILICITSAGNALNELAKEKPSNKQLEQHTSTFLKTLNHVELEMGKHINYLTQVSTGHSHEGSSYASQKVLQMAWHRSEHARSRVLELENIKNQASVNSAPKLNETILQSSSSSTTTTAPSTELVPTSTDI